MKFALVWPGIKSVLPVSLKNFLDVFPILCDTVRVDENVIKVHNDADVEEVLEDIVHEALESCQSVGESEEHDEPFERAIAGVESGFPFISVRDAD